MEIIKSKDNSKIKYIRTLINKKYRDSENAFTVEGIKFVKEAIIENAQINFVLISECILNKPETDEIIKLSVSKKIDYYICDDIIFNNASDTINSQGILAVIKKTLFNEEEIFNTYKFLIFCDRIQDPGNLGTIIRTADAFGPAAVILNKGCVDLYNPKVVRATAGAMFRVPFLFLDNLKIMSNLKENGYNIVSTVVNSRQSFDDIEMFEKICVVIGNEGQGVSQDIIESSHMNITIKMSGRAESLNASIAAGICIYEIRKKLL